MFLIMFSYQPRCVLTMLIGEPHNQNEGKSLETDFRCECGWREEQRAPVLGYPTET